MQIAKNPREFAESAVLGVPITRALPGVSTSVGTPPPGKPTLRVSGLDFE